MEKMQEMFTKDPEELKNKQKEMNNTLEGINSRITEAEELISDLEDRVVEIIAAKQNIEKRMKRSEDSLRDLWDNIHSKGPFVELIIKIKVQSLSSS